MKLARTLAVTALATATLAGSSTVAQAGSYDLPPHVSVQVAEDGSAKARQHRGNWSIVIDTFRAGTFPTRTDPRVSTCTVFDTTLRQPRGIQVRVTRCSNGSVKTEVLSGADTTQAA